MEPFEVTEIGGRSGDAGYFVSNAVLRDGQVEALGVWVESGVIVRFEAADVARKSSRILRDFGDAPLTPAWVNGHVHLAMAPLRGIGDQLARAGNLVEDVFFRVEKHFTAADVRAFARIGAIENVLSGTGEVWDHYYFAEEVAEALVEVGLPGTVASTIQDRGGPFGVIADQAIEETLKIHESPRFRRSGVRAALGPHASDTVSDGLFARIVDVARERSLPVHMHLAQSLDEYRRIDPRGSFGKDVASRVIDALSGAPLLFAHGLFLDRAALERLVRARAVLAYCPSSQLQFGVLGPFGEYLELGGAAVLGTDAVASNDAHDVQRELSFASGYGNLRASFGASRLDFFDSASEAGAKKLDEQRAIEAHFRGTRTSILLALAFGEGLCGLDGRPRGMRVGAEANFQVFDPRAPELYPEDDLPRRLAYGNTNLALSAMVLRGKVIESDRGPRGAFLEGEYSSWLDEARARRRELFERAGLAL